MRLPQIATLALLLTACSATNPPGPAPVAPPTPRPAEASIPVPPLDLIPPPMAAPGPDASTAPIPAPDQDAEEWETYMDLPVPEGARVAVTCEREEWVLGETCILRLELSNVGDAPFRITLGPGNPPVGRPFGPDVSAVHENGTEAEVPGPYVWPWSVILSPASVLPAETIAEEVLLPLCRRLDRPGLWAVHVRPGFGWKDEPGRPVPSSTITLRFREPTEDEARRIVDATLAPNDGSRFGGIYERPWHEPLALALPLYLPLVSAKAREGNSRALEALTGFRSVEAVRVLIERLPHLEDDDFSLVSDNLGTRLPMPPSETFHPFLGEGGTPAVPWDTSLTPLLQAWATRELENGNPAKADIAKDYLDCLAVKGDVHALRRALERALAAPLAPELGPPGESLPSGAWSLYEAWRAAGGVPAFPPAELADVLGFLEDLKSQATFRPAGWEGILARLLVDPTAWVRVRAAEACPVPMPPEVEVRLPLLLRDPSSAVRGPAYRLAGGSRDATLQKVLLERLGEEPDPWILEDAFLAACATGQRLAASRALLPRLDRSTLTEDGSQHVGSIALSLLGKAWIEDLESSGHSARGDTLTAEQWKPIRDRWKAFLDGPAVAIGAGRFHIGDPDLAPELFAPAITFHFGDRSWPPEKR